MAEMALAEDKVVGQVLSRELVRTCPVVAVAVTSAEKDKPITIHWVAKDIHMAMLLIHFKKMVRGVKAVRRMALRLLLSRVVQTSQII
jgi:hypothetical protein